MSTEQLSPYGNSSIIDNVRKIRIPHLQQLKSEGKKWAMLTAYDMFSAQIFEEAGIPVLLVGDSASNNVLGNSTSLPITVDEMLPMVRAVSQSTQKPLIIADLPFGSYQASAEQCFHTAVKFMKEAGAHAVKIEGNLSMLPQVEKLALSGIPVMAHIGFTPQSEHQLGGYRIQGKGDSADELIEVAKSFEKAGAFALLIEMIPSNVATRITQAVSIPTVGIGAGSGCDAQVLVWQDMAGMRTQGLPKFVKQYADMRTILSNAAKAYIKDVEQGTFPDKKHSF